MGMIIGRDLLDEETPKYDVAETGPGYEIRQYAPSLVAEVTYDGGAVQAKGANTAFYALANYIGVFSKPENIKSSAGDGGEAIAMTAPVITEEKAKGESYGEKIAMTAPVITQEKGSAGEKIAMTAPVITSELDASSSKQSTMQFVLPSKYTLQSAPKPTNPSVSIKELPGRKLAATTFYGNVPIKVAEAQAAKLKAALEERGIPISGGYQVAQYHGPFTLPPFRKNEIFYSLE